jgi:hypothetical protein
MQLRTLKSNCLLAIAGLCVFSATSYGNMIFPGQQGQTPDNFDGDPLNGTLLATLTEPLNSLTFMAVGTTAVYRGGMLSLCPTCLTFVYQVIDMAAGPMGTGVIEDLTASNFTGYLTDVGFDNTGGGPFIPGGISPCTVGRTATGPGSTVSFDYPNSTGGTCNLVPLTYTATLVIETNASMFGDGLFSAIDGATATGTGFAPFGPAVTLTPEPATMALLGSSLFALGFFRRRNRV